jgi:putative FmdB family regulatory protein
MPVYEYYCLSCEEKFKVLLGMSEKDPDCKNCKSEEVVRVVSSIGSKIDKTKFTTKAGDLVKKHIEDAKTEVKARKQKMKEGMK